MGTYRRSLSTLQEQAKKLNQLASARDEKLCAALKPFVERKIGEPIRRVFAHEENSYDAGYCETCSFWVKEFNIYYKDRWGESQCLTYDGLLTELICELVE